jgi:uncharacterized protein YggT (Ycf19 family)
MGDSYEREEVRRETTDGEPVVRPVDSLRTSRTSIYREGVYADRVAAVVWWIVGLIDTLIAIRFILKLLGASTASGFVQLMYSITEPLVAPFHGIFNTTAVNRSVFEPESLVAFLIYLLIGWGIVSLIRLLARPRSTTTYVP